MRKYLLLLPILFAAAVASAQEYPIMGMVQDARDESPLVGAHISLTSQPDGASQAVVSDETGRFRLMAKPGAYELAVTFLGFHTYTQGVVVENGPVRAGRIALEDEALNLEEAVVKEKLPTATMKGDTTQFNAGAYKVNPDASAENLIKKMPGVVVQGGQVQAQGENVQEVLVDGKPFFGNDPMAALRNLPAEVIDKIQVFDRQSDQAQFTGVDDGQTTKTINIITKPGMRSGQFGKVYGGYGPDGQYQAGGNANLFKGDSRLSVIGQSNNINQQNFSTEDLLGVVGAQQSGRGGPGGGRRGGGRRGGGGSDVNDFLVGEQNGISTTHAFGLNYTDKWGEKADVSGSYFFNRTDNDALTKLYRDYVNNSDFEQIYDEDSRTAATNTNHRFNLRMDYKIDSSNSLLIVPRLGLQYNDGMENTTGINLFGGEPTSKAYYELSPNLKGLNFSNMLLFRHRFEKRGRTFSLNLNTGYNKNTGKRYLLSENTFFEDVTLSDTLDQFSDLFTNGWEAEARASYTEPMGKQGIVQFDYEASYQKGDSEQETFGLEKSSQEYRLFNPVLSNTFSSNYLAQRAGLGYRLRGEKAMLFANLRYQWAQLEGDQVFPVADQLSRNFYNLVPGAFFRYQFSKQENLRVGYRASTNPPSISQLQEAIDNSNPLQIRVGNPELNQNYQHRLFARYSLTNTEKSTVFYAMLSGQYSDNYIANHTFTAAQDTTIAEGVILQQGAQLIRPVNLDGYRNVRSFITYGLPVPLLRSNLNINLSADYTRQPGQVNGELNYANNTTFGAGLVLSSNISERVDFTLSSRSSFSTAENSLSTRLNTQYFSQNSSLLINLIIADGFVFRTTLDHQLYSGLSEGFDQNYWLWNMGVAKKLFKNQRGEVQLSVFDLLKQNTSIQRNITEAYIEDVQTEVLQQYAMLTFTYQIRNFGSAPERQGNEERRDWRD
ncbi:MAG: TonB-dependent receptor [Lewinellaceae bacterium]|nr:TonB-dependent receptor [Phaeodactylibacter sp.]MCB9348775.1 TonB-dependent receptor [Lewinellaceae bacterium]